MLFSVKDLRSYNDKHFLPRLTIFLLQGQICKTFAYFFYNLHMHRFKNQLVFTSWCYLLFVQILRPMMLRRLKEDVEKNLAPKEETIIEVN